MKIISITSTFSKYGNIIVISSIESYILIKSGLINIINKSILNQLI